MSSEFISVTETVCEPMDPRLKSACKFSHPSLLFSVENDEQLNFPRKGLILFSLMGQPSGSRQASCDLGGLRQGSTCVIKLITGSIISISGNWSIDWALCTDYSQVCKGGNWSTEVE
jgi:hypothetical protein